MKIAILKCETVSPPHAYINGDYDSMFRKLMKKSGQIFEMTTFDVVQEIYPNSVDNFSAYISTGSRRSVYENEQWILKYADYLKQLFEKGKKHIGICFGHQMTAHALGGRVERSEKGWGVGVKEVQIKTETLWMKPGKRSYNLIVSHKDQVVDLPPGAIHIGENAHCKYSMFQIHDHFLSLQAHPEFNGRYAEALLRSRTDIIGEALVNKAIASLSTDTDETLVAGWFARFICTC